jgi:hypothetical protein
MGRFVADESCATGVSSPSVREGSDVGAWLAELADRGYGLRDGAMTEAQI